MNKPLLISLAAAALLSTNLNAQSMLERFEAMEREMNSLKQQIATLKSEKAEPVDAEEADEDEEEESASNDSEDTEAEEGVVVAAGEAEDDDEDDEDEDEIVSDEERIDELEEAVAELTRNTSGSHLKFKIDYRFAIENMQYDLADGSEAKNDAFMTNRLWIDMGYKATNNLSFKGQLAYNKAFGARSGVPQNNMDSFDWIANENAYDDTIRVRQAYFLWQDQEFFGLDMPWTFSVGRRPSTNGHLINLRDDDHASSPLAHGINVEFDGASARFTLSKEWGTSIKLCAGRGMSNASSKFSNTPYAKDESANTNIDLAGLIFVLYDDKQYSLNTMYYYANNLIDSDVVNGGFESVGGMHSGTANITMNGIGDEWSDFLDDTTFFISGAFSQTNPNNNLNSLGQANGGMLGSQDSETGYSYWLGTQFPSLATEDGRWGVEFNHGSKYWRAITYAEDTNIGSKIAARGDAFEAYMTEYLVDDILSIQLRYTYIDYDYTGSNGFFGNVSGAPTRITSGTVDGNGDSVVKSAQDIRFYIRYRY
jgi:hypothetical protein